MSKKKKAKTKRLERRFSPKSDSNPWVVRILFAAGASAMGAGAWAHTYGHVFEEDEKLRQVPLYLVSGGALLLGVSLWLGTSSAPPIRVGAPGVGIERGEVRRIPWHGLDKLTWEESALSLALSGVDEAGKSFSFKVPLKSQPDAVAWIVKEARERVPKVVDLDEEILEKLPAATPHAGMRLELEPLQVVGKKCAVTDETISYEPDARVCVRCERVYEKSAVPKKCKCGASLAHLKPTDAELEEAAAAEAARENEDEQVRGEAEEA